MEKRFKVQAILEKVELLEVNGQYLHPDCLVDCTEVRWLGNKSHSTKGCYNKQVATPYRNSYL
ncbi:Uncharacterised protein [[Clostridium] sordellii]|uniref:hypothetical protein n=1 Tax=Paraclostridium sordellii TaxID=1505 RepID=UPI0005E05770|nr:hypothetical protein [Paeniclostridium sordellii]CEN30896.1 Uncharacterised protein [[Clostridium] sordellii] [Paeniclostridium sordellii]